MVSAAAEVNKACGKSLAWPDAMDRLTDLQNRYDLFKLMTEHPRVWWDRDANTIHTTDKIWARMIAENELAKAYVHNGEPEYVKLRYLFANEGEFGLEEVNVVANPDNVVEIINITDSPVVSVERYHGSDVPIVISDDEGETLPSGRNRRPTRRNLFNEVEPPLEWPVPPRVIGWPSRTPARPKFPLWSGASSSKSKKDDN